jgi:outer membrane protein OmpA-like peptidoglycan-associated protein
VIAIALCGLAAAQDGFDAHGFVAAPEDGGVRDPVALERPTDLVQGRWYAGALVEAVDRPLVYTVDHPDDTRTELVSLDDVLALDVTAGAVVVDRVRLGLAAPVFLRSTSLGEPQMGGLGDLRLSAAIAALDPHQGDPIGLAAIPYVDLPTGDASKYLGQPGIAGGVKIAVSADAGPVGLTANLGTQLNPGTAASGYTNANTFELGGAIAVAASEFVGFGLEARVAAPFEKALVAGTMTPAEAMLTSRVRTRGGAHFVAGIGTALSSGVGASNWRLVVGGGFGSGDAKPKDTDLDGLVDKVDACPDDPETVNQWKDDDGCPDQLATVAVTVHRDGKPVAGADVTATHGADAKRGVSAADAPWLVEGLMPGTDTLAVRATQGSCLVGEAQGPLNEGRNDVVVDLKPQIDATVHVTVLSPDKKAVSGARIRWTPEDAACVPTTAAAVGAAGTLDQPLGAGVHGLIVDAQGYGTVEQKVEVAAGAHADVTVTLKPTKVKVTGTQITILEQVFFETGKAIIKPESFALLDEVATTIRTHPEIAKLEVAGHTDNQGSDSANLDLSQRRADSVRTYLVEHGVDPKTLTAVGYGETKPIDSNNTTAGRAKNRRVVFTILEHTPG